MTKYKIENKNILINIWPYRSLNRNQMVLIFFLITIILCLLSFLFFKIGAWPVSSFFGIDLLLILIVFVINFLSKYEYETIQITNSKIIISRKKLLKKKYIKVIPDTWVEAKILIDSKKNKKLYLNYDNKMEEIGSYLSNEEKLDLRNYVNKLIFYNGI